MIASSFRIYCDTRFSKDKSPFKPAAGAQFPHRVLGAGDPCCQRGGPAVQSVRVQTPDDATVLARTHGTRMERRGRVGGVRDRLPRPGGTPMERKMSLKEGHG